MRLLIVDDEPGLAEAMAVTLRMQHGYSAALTATSFEAGLQVALEQRPDIAILDHHLGKSSRTGLELAGELRKLAPGIKSLIMTGDESGELAMAATQSAACGLLLKNSVVHRLGEALDAVRRGEWYLDARAGLRIAQWKAKAELQQAAAEREARELGLSITELAVLRALAQGWSVRGIAEARGKSIETIRTQLKAIYAKLGVSSREEAVRVAGERGLLRVKPRGDRRLTLHLRTVLNASLVELRVPRQRDPPRPSWARRGSQDARNNVRLLSPLALLERGGARRPAGLRQGAAREARERPTVHGKELRALRWRYGRQRRAGRLLRDGGRFRLRERPLRELRARRRRHGEAVLSNMRRPRAAVPSRLALRSSRAVR